MVWDLKSLNRCSQLNLGNRLVALRAGARRPTAGKISRDHHSYHVRRPASSRNAKKDLPARRLKWGADRPVSGEKCAARIFR